MTQTVYLTDTSLFTGILRFEPEKANVPGDTFHRTNHHWFDIAKEAFYNKYIDNLVVFEWQHSTPNYEYILKHGIRGSLEKIEQVCPHELLSYDLCGRCELYCPNDARKLCGTEMSSCTSIFNAFPTICSWPSGKIGLTKTG